jgi:hypothetical protein
MRLSRRATAFSAAILFLSLLATGATADDVTTSAGKKLEGKLVGVDAKGISFATKDAKVDLLSRDIVEVFFGNKLQPEPKETYCAIELSDGSTIRVKKFLIKGKKFEVEQLPGPTGLAQPTYVLPLTSVFSAMKKADDANAKAAWQKMLTTRGKRDLYVVAQPTGFTYFQGTILEGFENKEKKDQWEIRFEKEGGGEAETLLQVRAAGYVFYQPQPANVPPTICRVMDIYGNALNATSIALAEGSVTVTTVSGATVKYASTAALVRLDYQRGNVAYVSDLNPKVDQPQLTPEEAKLNPTVPYLRDRALSNDTLKLDNQLYQKGLCIAPDTVLAFDLKGDYTQFLAMAGIDENGANATSAAKLTIEGDGQVLFTGTLTRKDKAKALVLAVKGVKQLRIIVEADTPLNGNYVTLADARVQK